MGVFYNVPRPGLEPGTYPSSGERSTNWAISAYFMWKINFLLIWFRVAKEPWKLSNIDE